MANRRARFIDAGRPAVYGWLFMAASLFAVAPAAQACPFCGGRGGAEADVAFYAMMALIVLGLLRKWWRRRR